MNEIDILYTVDHNYTIQMAVSILSLLKNNQNLKKICLHIIFDNLSIDDFTIIDSIVKQFSNSDVKFYDYDIIQKQINKYNIPNWRGSSIANARLFFSFILKDISKILYIDSDTIINGKLTELATYQGTIHAILDHQSKDYWTNLNCNLKRYFNSGVLWIDKNNWDKFDCDKKIADTLSQKLNLTFPDQDILNIALSEDISILPPEYNFFPYEWFYGKHALKKYYKVNKIEYYSEEQIKQSIANPIILHLMDFYGIRPWQENNIHPFNEIYRYYYFQLFNELSYNDNNHLDQSKDLFKLINYLKLYTPQSLKYPIKKLLKK